MAVNVSNIEIAWYDPTQASMVTMSRRSTSDSFSMGDLVSDSTDTYVGTCDVVASADKSQFIGVSMDTIDGATDTSSKVLIAMKAVLRAPLLAAQTTLYINEAAAWSAGANGTTWYLANTSTEAIAHCLGETIVAAEYGRFLIDIYTVRAVTAYGFFELVA